MMRKIYRIPKGSTHITVEAADDGICVSFEPASTCAFLCEKTEELEYIPGKGDLTIFWNDTNPAMAIIAKMEDIQMDESGCNFQSLNRLWYNHAIRFRNQEQYDKILESQQG